MAFTMLEKTADRSDKTAWSPEIMAEFERERQNPNPCVGSELVSESDRVRVWMIPSTLNCLATDTLAPCGMWRLFQFGSPAVERCATTPSCCGEAGSRSRVD